MKLKIGIFYLGHAISDVFIMYIYKHYLTRLHIALVANAKRNDLVTFMTQFIAYSSVLNNQ